MRPSSTQNVAKRVMPVIRAGTRFQPVFVTDVARAVALSVLDRLAHRGQTYELGGPQVLTVDEVVQALRASRTDLAPLVRARRAELARDQAGGQILER